MENNTKHYDNNHWMKSETLLRGYVDHNERIGKMIQAGINLEEWRKGRYDFPEGTDENSEFPNNPTRRKGYDMADASEDQRRIEASLTTRRLKELSKRSRENTKTRTTGTTEDNQEHIPNQQPNKQAEKDLVSTGD
jgi:serine kinase of HPr protein (carbohydrate metabolism regulator)